MRRHQSKRPLISRIHNEKTYNKPKNCSYCQNEGYDIAIVHTNNPNYICFPYHFNHINKCLIF